MLLTLLNPANSTARNFRWSAGFWGPEREAPVPELVLASMFAVQIDTPRLALMHRRAKNVCGDEPALQRIEERRNDVFVTTAEAQATACLRSETLTLTSGRARSVFVMREVENAVVRKSDVVEMTEG